MDRTGQADALIDNLRRQAAGRLTVFLGAAPGVGKTYAMLARARELQRQGVDVVAAVIETHGRADTQALAEGLPSLPRRRVDYQGRPLEEMDLDALLARHPAVALVDELAHRNAPGSRHAHRWQDVLELLDAGIDVYTTVNVQHLESLNDVVHQITGVRVRETVPDAVFERLRDIRLVDLPPRELIERLHQGKVYLPGPAAQALQAFFTPSNLAALRELAMQTVALHVDADLRETRNASGLQGLPLQNHVLVAIDGQGHSEYLVRAGARIAERRGAPWSVVSVDAGRMVPRGGADLPQQELDRAFALARRLGAETEVLHGTDIAQVLLDAAAARSARAIVIGRTRERPVARIFNRTLSQQLLRRGAHHELTIVGTPASRMRARRMAHRMGLAPEAMGWADAALVLGATGGAVAVAALAERTVELDDLSMVFLVAVLLVAARTHLLAAFATALLCFVAYNFFFIEPRFTLEISASRGVATVLLFLAAALIAGRLAARLRMQVVALRAANSHATALQNLGRRLAVAADLGQVLAAGGTALQSVLPGQAWLRVDGQCWPADPGQGPADKDLAAADWTEQHGQPSGRFTETLSGAQWWCLPLRADPARRLGVVALRLPPQVQRLGVEQRRLTERMVEDLAEAALRARLVTELESTRVAAETEQLRSALLSSVSHDLRSPLASMIGAAGSLARYGQAMDQADRDGLLETIQQEGERLDRYIQNLLDMTRLGQEGLTLARDWIGVDELVGAASTRLRRFVAGVQVDVDVAPGLPPIHVHPALVEQALFNVMENAAKFSPPGEAIRVVVRRTDEGLLQLDVSDRGPGIPEAERRRIFDMFYSVERGDRGRHGTGLGLAIVQGIIGAHGGSVEALPGPQGQGTTLRMQLPWGAS